MQGMAQLMFALDEPGVILFDDFDLGVRNVARRLKIDTRAALQNRQWVDGVRV
jgi:hypothetical protein